jgi:outer membrane protein
MTKFLRITAAAAALTVASAFTAQAQVKVGMVDMNLVFSSYYKTKDAESKINEARAAAKKELDERMESLKKNLDEIKKLEEEIQKPELSKDAKEQKLKQREQIINAANPLKREIDDFRTSREKQLQDQAVRMRNEIVKEITAIIQDRVQKDNYDLVFDKSGSSLNGVPIVLASRDAMDFSKDIIDTLNKNRPKDSGAEAATPTPAKK